MSKRKVKETKAPKSAFSQLSAAEQKRIAKKIVAAYMRMGKGGVVKFGAGKYNVVGSQKYVSLRERASIEHGGEDDALSSHLRAQFLNLARNGVRNNETLNIILNQVRQNVVGVEGGKAFLDVAEDLTVEQQVEVRRMFSRWTRECEFSGGMSFNESLKIIVQQYLLGGDMVLVFDDGLIAGSGRIIGFEPDSIGNLKKADFEKRFGKEFSQSQGVIKDKLGVIRGVILSSSQRGEEEYDLDKVIILTRDQWQTRAETDWVLIRNVYRFNQGRGSMPMGAMLGPICDLADVKNFEVQAAKANAQTVAQIVQTSAEDDMTGDMTLGDPAANAGYDDEANEAVEEAINEAEADMEDDPVTLEEIKAAGVMYDVMPANSRMELLDTKHPNSNMAEFINWLAGTAAASIGLARMYATLHVDSSYSGCRGEMLVTWPMFYTLQKTLEEKVCDWVFARWYKWAIKTHQFSFAADETNVPDVDWDWPRMPEVNPVDEQNVINLALKNGSRSYRDVLGPNWRARLKRVADERKYCSEIGFPHPADETVSGQLIGQPKNEGENNG